jgi:hypothetical protein
VEEVLEPAPAPQAASPGATIGSAPDLKPIAPNKSLVPSIPPPQLLKTSNEAPQKRRKQKRLKRRNISLCTMVSDDNPDSTKP